MNKNRLSLIILPLALLSLLVLPRMLNYGMFIDGVHFAGVARNLAEGEGSFWRPYYTETVYPVETEHPPLGFWLQSMAFRVFGDSVRVESFWGYFVGLLLLLEIAVFWKLLCRSPDGEAPGPWAPMTIFCLFPLITWGLSNNMLENTMTFFVLLAGILVLAALQAPKPLLAVAAGVLSGFALFAAFLVKGPAGLFVVVLPVAMYLSVPREERHRPLVVLLAHFSGLLAAALFILLPQEEAMGFLKAHFERQIIPSLAGKRETGSRFFVLVALAGEIAVPLALATGLRFSLKGTSRKIAWKKLAPILVLALAGSVSFVVSPKQARRYLIPSLPFYAMTITFLFNGLFLSLEERLMRTSARRKIYHGVMAALLAVALFLTAAGRGRVRRDAAFYGDFISQRLNLPERLVIGVCPESVASDWGMVANMQRWFKASLAAGPGTVPGYYLTADASCDIPDACTMIHPPDSHRYRLYECGPAAP